MEIKDKPNSMSVREWIVKKIATGTMIPETTIKSVMNHQFDSAYEALKTKDSIEISGFGKLYYNRKKAVKELEKALQKQAAYEELLNSESTTEKERRKTEGKLELLLAKIEKIKKRYNGEAK